MAIPLKDQFFTNDFIDKLSQLIIQHNTGFDLKKFNSSIHDEEWKSRALKAKMRHVSECIHQSFQENYTKAIDVLSKVAPRFEGFNGMVFPDFVEVYGLQHKDISIDALEHFTKFSSAEFAIRPFIKKWPLEVMKKMLAWSKDSNEHVRRLASEGCRPKLPWAVALPDFQKDPSAILPILDQLKSDPSLYVRKSVANNINDISKDNPELILSILKDWKKENNKHTDWIINHGLRTLIKRGNTEALQLLGFTTKVEAKISPIQLSKREINIGETLSFSFDITSISTQDQNLVIDYILYFKKANGKHLPKVFKLSNKQLLANKTLHIEKKHPIKEISTRKYYEGDHFIEIQVNGKPCNKEKFNLRL